MTDRYRTVRHLRHRACSMQPAGAYVLAIAVATAILAFAPPACASTYVVYIPLDDPIYTELDTLNDLGLLDSYLSEVKPFSRIEAARLTLEAERIIGGRGEQSPARALARANIRALKLQLAREIAWLEEYRADNLPTMIVPLQRIEARYVFSHGECRAIHSGNRDGINADEATPLLPNNNSLPTSPGSNESARASGWFGLGGFITAYGEGSGAGPVTRGPSGPNGADLNSRFQVLGAEGVVGIGNFAISFGQQEMDWGVGHFAQLSQSNNARPFPALRIQNIKPGHLPFFLRYFGLFRFQAFFGQLDDDRYYSHPWIAGQIFAFKPLPSFEFGLIHTIAFGGAHNDHYGLAGFIGRATGVATGNPADGNTNSRGGIYLRFHISSLRNLEVYQEILGEDNLAYEVPTVGHALPFLSVSYQGGVYLPRLTSDGLTDLRFEYAILEPNYSTHSDSLYSTNNDTLMGDPLGPNASRVDVQLGRWVAMRYKLVADLFYTERAPTYLTNTPVGLHKERSLGFTVDLFQLPIRMGASSRTLAWISARTGFEYVHDINYDTGTSVRAIVSIKIGLQPGLPAYSWR
jgi:Capsule assembly protein Wzi